MGMEMEEEMSDEELDMLMQSMFQTESMDEEEDMEEMEMEESEEMEEGEDEVVYEIEMDEEDYDDMENMNEGKMTIKPVMGKLTKSSLTNKAKKMETKEGSMMSKPVVGRGVKTGTAKFEYKEGENAGSKLGTNKVVKKTETKEGSTRKPMVKKVETKEASRTLGAGSNFRKGGLPKPRAHSSFNTAIKESSSNKELQILREKNEEYRKALNVFRSKLNEVAVFNSNLAYATRLFTEHSTSKQEKINILRRFDGVETIKESKNLYQVVKNELSAGTKTQSMNE